MSGGIRIRICGSKSDFLEFTVHGRLHPHATDFWDGNWLDCTAEVTAGAFRGSLKRPLRIDEIGRFHDGVAELYDRLTGEAVLDTMEHWLNLRLIGDGSGHIEARGQLCDDPAGGNVLEFRLFFDQTFLPPLMRQLRSAINTFPVIGAP